MPAVYTDITRADIEEFLTPLGFTKMDLPNVRELVYGKRVDRDGLALSLRVFTGIDPNGHSRDVGEDAIRCVVFWRNPEGEVKKVATSKRVHRVAGWKKNLGERLEDWKLGPVCSCGSPMVERKSKNGKFFGCSNFPACRQTKAIDG